MIHKLHLGKQTASLFRSLSIIRIALSLFFAGHALLHRKFNLQPAALPPPFEVTLASFNPV